VRLFSVVSVVVVLSAVLPLSQSERAHAQRFSLYAYAFMNSEQQPSIQVNSSVGYNSLVFFKRKNVFESTFEVYLKLMDRENNVIDTAVLKKKVSVQEYQETKSAKHSAKVSRQFAVAPGPYTLEASLAVKNTQLKAVKRVDIDVPDFLASGIGIGTPRLYSVSRHLPDRSGTLVAADEIDESDFAEIESHAFAGIENVPALRFEIYSEAGAQGALRGTLYAEVSDGRKNQLYYHATEVELSGRGDAYFVLLDVDDWELGGYVLNVKMVMENPRREAAATMEFRIGFTRAMLDRYFEDTLDMLSIIASGEELSELEAAALEERARAWTAFWKRRDPSPGTETNEALEQYLTRIQYVTTHFSNLGHGWRTDRGKIYLRYGPPDVIESTIDSSVQGEYLIWRYYDLNLVFVFYDRFYGVGDFRLISTNAY
jgi:GWxTD domain-containing protein